jgi:dCMP deaminase
MYKNTDLFQQARYKKWDKRFLDLAKVVGSWSKDPSTQVGAVIVRPNFTVASVGFNGFPSKMQDTPDLYSNREEKLSRIVHAEMNSMLHCREVIKDYIMYVTLLPCDRCIVHAAQAGISRFVAPVPSLEHQERWGTAFAKARSYAAQMGLELVEYDLTESKQNQILTISL